MRISRALASALNLFEILIFYLEKVGRGHGVQLSQLRHSTADIETYESRISHYSAIRKIRPSSWPTTFTMAPFDDKYKVYKSHFYV